MSGSLQETGSGSVKGNYENELLRFLPHDLEFQRDPCSPVLLLAACESDSKLKPTFKYNSVCRILLKEVSAGAARQSTVRSASKDSIVRQKGGRSGVLQDLLPKLSQVVENPSDPDQTHLTLPADSKLWCRDKAVKRVPPPSRKLHNKTVIFRVFCQSLTSASSSGLPAASDKHHSHVSFWLQYKQQPRRVKDDREKLSLVISPVNWLQVCVNPLKTFLFVVCGVLRPLG